MRIHTYLTLLCLCLLGSATISAQSNIWQGPVNGDWFTPGNWSLGSVPAAGQTAIIGGGNSAVIGSPLTVDFTIENFGTVTTDAAITNGGTINNSGTLTISTTGSLTNNVSFSNFGTATFQSAATFSNSAGATFTNGGSFTLQTTLVNLGSVVNNGTIDASNGTLQTQGTFDNNQTLTTKSLTISAGATFTNNFGSTLNITGAGAILQISGSMTNNGTVNNSGAATLAGTLANNVNFNTLAGFSLTVNAGATLTNTGNVNNAGSLTNNGTITNNNQFVNSGTANNNGTFNNNNVLNNQVGGTFNNNAGSSMSLNFGTQILNGGTFTNASAINSFGLIQNDATFTNNGSITSNSGGTVDNNGSNFTNNGTLSTSDQFRNDGTFFNQGIININAGSVLNNFGNFTNRAGGTINNLQEIRNKQPNGIFTNNGTLNNNVRFFAEDDVINNAYFNSIGDVFIEPGGGKITNTELLYLNAGNLKNQGTLVNSNKVWVNDCSTLNNVAGATINNNGNLELHGILFQRGTLAGNAVNNQGGYIHTGATSAAPSICQNGTFAADINGDVKVYASQLISNANFDSCANIVYLANGIDRPVFHCSDIGTVLNLNVVLRTRLLDSLTCVAQVTPVDLLEPQFSNCPKDQVVFTPNNTVTATWTAPTATDNCTTVTLTPSHSPGASFPVGITGVTYTAADTYGNSNQCQFRIDVRKTAPGGSCTGDATPPVFVGCPANISKTTNGSSSIAGWLPPTATDNCYPIILTSSHAPGAAFPLGGTTVTYTAKDGNNNPSTCTFTVTVTAINHCAGDVTKPIINGCPKNIYLPTNPVLSGAVAVWTPPGAFDFCGVTQFTGTHSSGSVFPTGTTTVIYTAKDAASNTSTCSFTITVGADPCPGDVAAPLVSNCPANINLTVSGFSGVANWTAPTASDACAPVTVNATHTPGSTFSLGSTQVSYQFSDKKGNTSFCIFNVNVQNACDVDVTPPVISGCPANVTVGTSGTSAPATWTPPTVSDNCAMSYFAAAYLPGAVFPLGTTSVVYTAIDVEGNGSNCSFNVIIVNTPGCTTNAAPIDGTTDVNPASVALSWNTAAGATAYDIYLGTTNPPTTVVAANVAGTSTTVTNLSGGATYFWYVVPKNAAGSASGCASSATQFSTSASGGGGCNKTALFVVGSTSLNASEAFLKTRLESFGFTVTVADDYAVTTANATGKGLILISSTVNSSYVNTKFTNTAVPLINWESYLHDDLKLTSSSSSYHGNSSASQITIQTPSHQIAAGLTGTVSVFSSSKTVTWGIPGTAAAKIGYLPGNSTKFMAFAYESGATMVGIAAPARRVGFYLFDNTATSLNANGLKMFDAAVFWATGCPPCSSTPTAICQNITRQQTATGQSVQISGMDVDNGSTPGCTGTITSYNVSPTSFSSPGTFNVTLTVTNSLGLSATCTATVTILPPPACSNITNGGTIAKACANGQIQLSNVTSPSGGSGTIEYLWISGTTDCDPDNMSPVAGANAATLNVAVPSVTTYYIRCSRRAGCTDWDGESNCITVGAYECQFDPNKCYKFVNKYSGKVLDIYGAGLDDNTKAIQWTEHGGDNQKFKLSDAGNGYLYVMARHSNKFLDTENAGSTADNAKAVQYAFDGSNSQQWKIESVGSGYFKITNKLSNKALKLASASTADGIDVVQLAYSNSDIFKWQLVEVSCCDQDALFVVGSTTLDAGDTWVKTRLETLGFTVTLRDDDAVVAGDGSGKGVVVISSTCNSVAIGAEFTNSNVPVVCWESVLFDDLKMTYGVDGTDFGGATGNSVTIFDASHPLAAGLSGTVQVYSSSNAMRWGWTTNSSAAKVAKLGTANRYGVFGYEKGAFMQEGFNAPARRVGLFMDNGTPQLLTANGIKLFDAAINWASKCNGSNFGEDVIEERTETTENELPASNATLESGKAITVFPNPAHDRLFVNLSEFAGKETLVRLFNANGQVTNEWKIVALEEPVELPVEDSRSGYHLLWILPDGEKRAAAVKIIIER